MTPRSLSLFSYFLKCYRTRAYTGVQFSTVYNMIVCTYCTICRSSPAQALPTPRPARSQGPWRPSTSGRSMDWPSQRSGTPTTPWEQRSLWRIRSVGADHQGRTEKKSPNKMSWKICELLWWLIIQICSLFCFHSVIQIIKCRCWLLARCKTSWTFSTAGQGAEVDVWFLLLTKHWVRKHHTVRVC